MFYKSSMVVHDSIILSMVQVLLGTTIFRIVKRHKRIRNIILYFIMSIKTSTIHREELKEKKRRKVFIEDTTYYN